MHRLLTAVIASATLTITSLPVAAQDYIQPYQQPYQADQKNFSVGPTEVIAGLIALGIIVKVIDNHKDKDAPAPVVVPPKPRPVHTIKPVKPAKRKYHEHRRTLPQHCLRNVSGSNRKMTLYGSRCLSQAHINVASLPKECAVTVNVLNGQFTGYRSRCMENRGYRTARY